MQDSNTEISYTVAALLLCMQFNYHVVYDVVKKMSKQKCREV